MLERREHPDSTTGFFVAKTRYDSMSFIIYDFLDAT